MSSEMEPRNNENRMILMCDLEKCTGCRICEYVCSFEKEKSFDLKKARIKAVRFNPTLSGALACTLCNEALCVKACPTEALTKSQRGTVVVDRKKCVRCGWCVYACDVGAVFYDSEQNVPIVCDLCDGKPKCMEVCPEEALKFEPVDEIITKRTISRIRNILH